VFNFWLAAAMTASAADLQLPTVVYESPVVYPEDAVDQLQTASVRLSVEIDDEGKVVDVGVLESPGPEFSDAAVTAMRSYRFTPAISDGIPVSVTVEYILNFTLDVQPVLSLQGVAKESGIRQPLADRVVELTGPDGQVAFARTDENGAFQVYDLPPGEWDVQLVAPGYDTKATSVNVEPGVASDLSFWAVPNREWEEEDDADYAIEVVYESDPPDVTERVISTQQAMALPGTNGDVLKVVQNFPGVNRPPLGIGQILIRGTSPQDSGAFLDGMRIPIVFHFSGLATVINGDSLDRIGFQSGNFGVRYGNMLGGLVDLETTSQMPERSRGYVSIDVYQAALFVEQKVSKRVALTVSGRRSYFDAILGPVLTGATGRTFQAPRYWDLQARMLYRAPNSSRLDLMFLFSDDSFLLASPDGETVENGLQTQFLKGRALYEAPLGGAWRNQFQFLIGPDKQAFQFDGNGEAFEKNLSFDVREEVRVIADDTDSGVGWRFGAQFEAQQFDFLYDIGAFGEPESGEGWRYLPSAYVENTAILGPVRLITGVRGGAQFVDNIAKSWTIDPRIKIAIDATPTTRFILASGRYSQWALPREVLPSSEGIPTLKPEWSLQNSLTFQQELLPGFKMEVTGFYNRLYDLISGKEDRFEFFAGPPPTGNLDDGPYANDGKGEIFGAEIAFRYSSKRFIAWITGTWSRSFRVDRPGGNREVFQYDQPILFNALATYDLPKRWTIGGRVRVGSGNPFDPVSNRAQNVGNHSFVPIYEEGGFDRVPTFWSIDVRVDKDWVFKKWTLTLYLDIQNVTNNQNPEIMGYTYDYSAQDPISGLPILPAFGLKGAW